MAQKCLLFAYGMLRPDQPNAPRSLSHFWPDRIFGRLVAIDNYSGAVSIGEQAAGVIDGYTMEIDEDELTSLDDFENVEGGEYRRRMVETAGGHYAWVYEYLGPS